MPDGRSGWDEMASCYDKTRALPGGGESEVPAAVVAKLRALGARRVLDLGCGTGRFLLPLAAAGSDVVGADRSPEMLGVLRAKPGAERLRIVRADCEALPFRRAFDAVVFSHFLHLVKLEPLARELCRALRPGGHVVVVDTGAGPRTATLRVLSVVKPLLFGEEPIVPDGTGKPTRDQEFLRTLLAHAGGEEVDVVRTGTYPASTSLREALDDVRARKWWRYRVCAPQDCARAADHAERALLAEGADLDAPVEEPVVVQLLVGRLSD
jgi:SAM-dependent methyltransferase